MNALFPIIAVLIWSVNVIVNKLSATVIDPAAISFYRWLLAFLVMTPFMLPGLRHHATTIRQNAWKLLVLGLLGMVLYQSLAYYAAHTISAVMMGIMGSLVPLLTVLLSIPLLRVAPTLGVLLGSLLSLAGIVWLISGGHPEQILAQGIGTGEFMMFCAALSYAIYGVLTKRWSIPLPNWVSLYVQIAFGVVLLIPNFLLTDNVQLNSENLPLVVFAGIMASIIAPFLWIQGVMRLGASKTAIFMNLTPIFAAMIAIGFLHEPLHHYHLVGGGITLLGVILAQRLRIPLGRTA
ncbi:DMT family transporter [Pectobacterium zantedeschiae]|uniref:DMT family transporter n=1 Tax=Pectobacterium zantedeschiae TaxID=2034769 RepID=A0A9X8JK07_9GAMM|nr:DMT family transporter [Pectobacterium zantedeschiae]RYC42961.1 EamA family transporter [Pectobacterium zantedeschiae]RYC43742.1 DMT family transporter [Pectobacterium zantedeschiae]RYC49037.1 EamA family transporter [Pectobacterium zantedeschiae]